MAQKTVTAYRRRLGIRLSWREARSSEEFCRQHEKQARAFVEHTRERWRQWRERRRVIWERRREELSRSADCPPARTCQECGETWFESREFFHVRLRRSADHSKVSYCRICRLCRAERRRGKVATAGAGALVAAHA